MANSFVYYVSGVAVNKLQKVNALPLTTKHHFTLFFPSIFPPFPLSSMSSLSADTASVLKTSSSIVVCLEIGWGPEELRRWDKKGFLDTLPGLPVDPVGDKLPAGGVFRCPTSEAVLLRNPDWLPKSSCRREDLSIVSGYEPNLGSFGVRLEGEGGSDTDLWRVIGALQYLGGTFDKGAVKR